jgi:TPR repeat protein
MSILKEGGFVDRPTQNRALSWLKKAGVQGHAKACDVVAGIYEARRDISQAREWHTKAAASGSLTAQNSLDSLNMTGKAGSDARKAALAMNRDVYLRKAAEEDSDAESQNRLGVMYANGDGADQSWKMAAAWCKKAAIQGYPDAQRNLSDMYERGCGVTKDTELAAEWRRKCNSNTGASNTSAISLNLAPPEKFIWPSDNGHGNNDRAGPTGSACGSRRSRSIAPGEVDEMSVKELKTTIRAMGLQSQMVGMSEKFELQDLIKSTLGA